MVEQIAPAEAAQWLDARNDVLLLDVREPWETTLVKIEGATLLPMSEFARRLGELPLDRAIVVLCHHGVRSNVVAHALMRDGRTDVFNVRGGIDAWASEVDPSLPRY